MRTPDEVLKNPKNHSADCQGEAGAVRFHKCQNPACPEWFPHRTRGQNKYHSTECGRSITANARQAKCRLNRYLSSSSHRKLLSSIPDLELAVSLDKFLESVPGSPGGRLESLSKEIERLDSLITTKGPIDSETRTELRTGAAIIVAAVRLYKPAFEDLNDYRIIEVRALELLRDTPEEGTLKPAAFRTVLSRAECALQFFLDVEDFPNVGRTLIALGNIYRVAGHDRDANQKFGWALHILKEKCDAADPFVASLLHEAWCWKLRTEGNDVEKPTIRIWIDELTRLAQRADDARRWVTHHRDVAGFAGYLLNDPDLVYEELRRLALRRRKLSDFSPISDPTLLTPAIEFLFQTRRRDQGIDLIRQRYLPLYKLYPNEYNYRKIANWSRKYGFEVTIPPAEYATAFLSYAPRYSPGLV